MWVIPITVSEHREEARWRGNEFPGVPRARVRNSRPKLRIISISLPGYQRSFTPRSAIRRGVTQWTPLREMSAGSPPLGSIGLPRGGPAGEFGRHRALLVGLFRHRVQWPKTSAIKACCGPVRRHLVWFGGPPPLASMVGLFRHSMPLVGRPP